MNLGKTGIGEKSAAFVCPMDRADVGCHGISGQIKRIAIAAGGQHHGIGSKTFDLACNQIANDNSPGLPIYNNQIQHFTAGEHFDVPGGYLP